MSGNLKFIKDHIKAVSNINKITTSMKMVSAAKYLKAERNLVKARPLGLAAEHFYILNPITSVSELLAKTIHLCPVTSDRGLCGSMPGKVLRYSRTLLSDTINNRIVCIGEKTRINFAFDLSQLICLVVNGIGHKIPTFLDASSIAQNVLAEEDFIYGKIIYSHFINVMNFKVSEILFYSTPLLMEAKEIDYYEIEDHELCSYVEFSIAALFYFALSETAVVELASRINAMSNASKNASEMRKRLDLQFNRLRQAGVTKEIIDVVSGAEVISSNV